MRVRRVGEDELDRLKDLRLRALLDAPGAFGRRYEEESDRDPEKYASWVTDGSTFVVEDDHGWHGLVSVLVDHQDRNVCHLLSMWTEPGLRRHGLGRLLVDAGVAWAQEQRVSRIVLGVVEDNQSAIRLYRRAGFQPTGQGEPLRSDPAKRVSFMSLDVSPAD